MTPADVDFQEGIAKLREVLNNHRMQAHSDWLRAEKAIADTQPKQTQVIREAEASKSWASKFKGKS